MSTEDGNYALTSNVTLSPPISSGQLVTPASQPQGEKKKSRASSAAEETANKAEEDEKRSKYCNFAGNTIVGIVLLGYIIYAAIFFFVNTYNQTTTVQFQIAPKVDFPTLFFQLSEYGNLEEIFISVFENSCKIQDTSNVTHSEYTVLNNPAFSDIPTDSSQWVIVNTSFSSYGFSGYGNYSTYSGSSGSGSSGYSYDYNYNYRRRRGNRRRQLLSSPSSVSETNGSNYYYGDYTYANYGNYYFENYSLSDYYSSSSSNIFYVYPPNNGSAFQVHTNEFDRCGDAVLVYLSTSVPKNAFKSANISGEFLTNLYVRSYPDSFGVQYGYDSRDAVSQSLENKHHVYYSGRISYGELKSEILQLTSYKDHVFHNSQDFYQSLTSIDYTNKNYNLSTVVKDKIYFDTYLFFYMNAFTIEYETVPKESWSDVLASIGGMQSTVGDPIAFVIALWLYGMSLACLQFDGKAPLDPLPDDFLKRLDVYLASKVVGGELRGGSAWATDHPDLIDGNA